MYKQKFAIIKIYSEGKNISSTDIRKSTLNLKRCYSFFFFHMNKISPLL